MGLCKPTVERIHTIARISGLPIRIPKGQWTQTIAIALVNTMAWNIFAVYGVQLMASGRAAILGYTMPVWGVITTKRRRSTGSGRAGGW